MPHYAAGGPSEFEWPPRDDVLEGQVFRLGDPIEPPKTAFEDAAPAAAHAGAAQDASQTDTEEPHVLLRRAIEARAAHEASDAATSAPTATKRSTRSHPRAGTVALAALLALVLLQSAYILRTWSGRSLWPGRALFSIAASETPPAQAPDIEAATPAAVRTEPPPATPDGARTAASTKPDVERSAARSAAAPPPGTRLMVRSDPPGARVSIDGRIRGITPVGVNGLAPGEHRVLLQRDGIEVHETIRLAGGGTVSLLVPMRAGTAATGWIAVESPIELDVFEADSLLGTSRSSRILLQAGQHTLQLVNQQLDFRDVRQVEVAAGNVVRIPVEIPRSEVFVNATPWADVWIDGQPAGQTPLGRLTLPIGAHDVVFRHPELGEKRTTAIVKAGAPTRVTVDMRP